MKLKTLSKLLAFGILVNSMPINSFAGILSEDNRYETFTGNNITVNDILEEEKVGVEIEGNTLVNIAEPNQVIKLKSPEIGNYAEANATLKYPLKGNTTYTISFNITQNPENHPPFASIVIGQGNNDSWSNRLYWDTNFKFNSNESYLGYHEITFTTGSRIEETSFYWIKFIGEHWNNQFDTIIEDLIIVEGDVNNLSYFDGVKSVGEENGKISVISQNKNIFDINNITTMAYSYGLPFINDSKIDFSIVDDTINYTTPSNIWNFGVGGIYKVKKNTLYTAKYEEANSDKDYEISINILGLYENDLNIEYWNPENHTKYTPRLICTKQSPNTRNVSLTYNSKDYDYLAIYIGSNWIENPTESRDVTLKNVGIYETRDSNVSYERYNTSEIEVLLNEPLRGLPNGVKDRIMKKNGQWVIERNLAQITFDGSPDEGWGIAGISKYMQLHIPNAKPDAQAISDRLLYNSIGAYVDYNPIGMSFIKSPPGIRIKPFLKDDMTLEEGIEWLRNNPITVIYELAEPIYEPINTNLSVQLFEETTYISNNSNIPANMEITVDRTLNRAVEAIELAKTNPTIENLSKARMWINLAKESIKKDELQNEINNITNIDDLELERKTASANVDIYIKSDNSLSMTLSTNSIMFDNYSGVSDMEKLNAVEVTVHSSLPYDLNAYLESEIQNSDKSTTIDSNLLQIKESSNLDYKTFNNTTDKVILEEDCPSGNYNKHNIDLKMEGSNAYKADVYKTIIKFEAKQK